ncbi:hypothetical protein [uncultured Azohydromonas sp.]|jgi:hypothetical protein|uniref:hypothetical protein n=1 Tax=uncultured Azohydromonas sp. TaxID=487342 RepID=UPI002626D0DD|nr:hypothetical protein [uncultured Azohydromonas sp.]
MQPVEGGQDGPGGKPGVEPWGAAVRFPGVRCTAALRVTVYGGAAMRLDGLLL